MKVHHAADTRLQAKAHFSHETYCGVIQMKKLAKPKITIFTGVFL
jgi:hypothetical protein